MTTRLTVLALLTLILAGCQKPLAQRTQSLAEARKGFTPHPTGQRSGEAVEPPPPNTVRYVTYNSPAGTMAAYLSQEPHDGKRHPGLVWITGGDCNTIGDVWNAEPGNDQTAQVYRSIGIVTIYPSMRGGNQNPGVKEGFYGEVQDVIAAANALRALPTVDPQRIYLGGHSTGGTLALLTSEMTSDFRGVFAFGAVDDVSGYPPEFLPFDTSNPKDVELRSPGYWLSSVHSPTWVIEGEDGNIGSLRAMKAASKNSQIHFIEVPGASHFSVLGPVNELIAGKIIQDTGATCAISITPEEAKKAFGR